MPWTLHLGVIDTPYGNDEGSKTTGDVAEILEDKYHIMRIFLEVHEPDIAKDLEHSFAGALENLFAGAPIEQAPFNTATSKIDSRFKDFLEKKEMDTLGYPGIPTQAALKGVNHRFKHPYKKRAPRPSFIDTGMYVNNFKSWVE